MSINQAYANVQELPGILSVFPLEGALLLPRGELPLNVFEPRYLALIDDALKTHRLIGMIQPGANPENDNPPPLQTVGCCGRITQIAETGDGRYVLTLTGVARFSVAAEMGVPTLYRQCRVEYGQFAHDLQPRAGEAEVDREDVLKALKDFAAANRLKIDWDGVEQAPNEALVNALAMMSPFGPQEKQALLEAPDLKARAEILVAITQIDLARGRSGQNGSVLQ